MVLSSGQEAVILSTETAFNGTGGTARLVPFLTGSFSIEENSEQVLNEGRRGIDAMHFVGPTEGVKWVEISWDGIVQDGNTTDNMIVGYLIDNILGAGSNASAVQIGSTGTYDHRLRLGTTKEYLCIKHRSLASSSDTVVSGCRVNNLSFTWNAAEGRLEYSVSLTGGAVTTDTVALATDNSGPHFMGWRAVVDFAGTGTSFARLISGEFTLTREVERFHTASATIKTPTDIFLGPLEVTAGVVLGYTSADDIADFRDADATANQTKFKVYFTNDGIAEGHASQAATSRAFGIGFGKAALNGGPAVFDGSGQFPKLAMSLTGLHNAGTGIWTSQGNAATSTVRSPIEFQILSAKTAAF